MTEQERYNLYRDLHIQAWQWQADNPEQKDKDVNPFLKDGMGGLDKCFACVYVAPPWGAPGISKCFACPCYWGKDGGCCTVSDQSPYLLWEEAACSDERKEYAEQVRDSWPTWEERLRK